jgi:integrase
MCGKASPRHRTNSISVLRGGIEKHIRRDISEITRQEFVSAIEAIKTAGAQQSFRQRLTPLLNFAVNQGLAQNNVLAGWKKPRRSKSVALTRSGRSLEKEEIRAIWNATATPTPFNGVVRVMLLTGLRNAETAALDWRWVDFNKAAIILPPERMRSGRAHAVPISNLLKLQLDMMPRVPGSSLVFPVRSKSKTWTVMSGFGQMLRKLHKKSGTKDWTLYDLRRTFRTSLAELGYDLDLCERMIAHSRGNLVERYDRSTRWPERVLAAETYSKTIVASALEQS